MDFQDKIVQDPTICGGVPVIRGTRVPLHTILASLADGDDPEEILKDFPSLTLEDIRVFTGRVTPALLKLSDNADGKTC